MPLLSPGDRFPDLTITAPGGLSITVPEAFAGHFGAVLFNRGSWCPFCNAQLRTFQNQYEAMRDAGIRLVSLSVDDEAATQALVQKHHLEFPVGHGADAAAVAAATGAFVNADPVYLQATGFVLDPSGNVVVSVYSSGAIGRLMPDDVIGMVRHVQEHAR